MPTTQSIPEIFFLGDNLDIALTFTFECRYFICLKPISELVVISEVARHLAHDSRILIVYFLARQSVMDSEAIRQALSVVNALMGLKVTGLEQLVVILAHEGGLEQANVPSLVHDCNLSRGPRGPVLMAAIQHALAPAPVTLGYA